MRISQTDGEEPITVDDTKEFVSKQDVTAGARAAAYTVEAPSDYVIGIDAGTVFAPFFVDAEGDKLDPSTTIIAQKADPQGNPLGNAIVFEDTLSVFDYEKMRADTDYYRYTHKPLLLDEREFLYIYLDIPDGTADFDAGNSRLTIGDKSTRKNQPCYIRQKNSLSGGQMDAVGQTSSARGQ